ncbi:MAG: PAS domain S-box protein [Desulfohalobiaceae bacterium]
MSPKAFPERVSQAGVFSLQGVWELLQHVPVGLFQAQPQGNYLAANPYLARMLGYSSPQELTSWVTDIPGQVHKDPADWQELLNILQDQGSVQGYKCTLLQRQGQELLVSINAEFVWDEAGNPAYCLGAIMEASSCRQVEDRQRSGSSRLAHIVYSTPIATFVIDQSRRITHWNLACEKLTGLREQDMQGTSRQWQAFYSCRRPVMADLLLEQDTESRLQEYYPGKWRRSSLVKGAYEAEDFFADLGNGGRWLFFTAAPITDQYGEMIGVVETLQDVTERKNAEKALQESERKYRTLIETASSGCWQVDDREITVDVNQALCDMLGYSREQIVGRTPMDFVDEENAEIFRNNSARNTSQTNRSYEITLRTKQGSKVSAQFNSSTLFDSSGRISEYFAFVTDISRQKEIEEALRQSEKRYKHEKEYLDNIFENSADAIAIVDWEGRFIRWNKRAAEMFGYSFLDMQGKHYSEFYARQEELSELLSLLGRQGFVHDHEVYFINKDGSLKPCSVSISKIHDEDGQPMGSISIVRDLTQWKLAQEKLEEMSLYDSLTSLYNRFFFEEEMQRLGDQRHTPIGIIVCDVDGLKLINDTLGHYKGDELLKKSAEILQNCFRRSDILARIGGDEFAVLLPDSKEEAVQACCQRVRHKVEEYNQQDPELGMSISIGYAVCSGSEVHMQELFKRADDAMYQEKLQHRASSSSNSTLQALFKTLEARDYLAQGHAERLQHYAQQLGESIGLSEERLKDLQLLARFHDLGKVGIADRILFKPGPLSALEFEEMQRHCEIGHRIAMSTSYLAHIADLILKHQERWDGKGYPLGLLGEDIPVECRILAVVDAFDVMTQDRPWQAAKSRQRAMQELKSCAGTQFDPDLVQSFLQILQIEAEQEQT